jgi:hypothetical protein
LVLPEDCLYGRRLRAALEQAVYPIAESGRPVSQPPQIWQRVTVPNPIARLAIQKALGDAWQWRAQRECKELLTWFRDASGDPLERRLGVLSVDPQTHLTLVLFIDGSRESACGDGVFAYTAPRSRVVRLCLEEVKRTSTISRGSRRLLHPRNAAHAGAGRNPPTSKDINHRVLSACAPRGSP